MASRCSSIASTSKLACAPPAARSACTRHATVLAPRLRVLAPAGPSARAVRVASSSGIEAPAVKYEHLLVALFDDNPYLSDASRQAVATAASFTGSFQSKVTVLFVDEEGREPPADGSSERIELIETALQQAGCPKFEFVERQSEPSVGKGAVAVGDVADQLEADLVVLHSDAVHSRHVDANLLAEFCSCPVLLLP